MDLREKLEELREKRTFLCVETTKGDYVGRIMEVKNNNVVLLPINQITVGTYLRDDFAIRIPIGTITKVKEIIKGKITDSS